MEGEDEGERQGGTEAEAGADGEARAEEEAEAEAKGKARRACGGGAGLLVRVAKLCHAPSVLPRHTPSSSTSFRARHRRARAREQLRQVAPLKGRSCSTMVPHTWPG